MVESARQDATRQRVKDAIERWEAERRVSVRDTRDLLDGIMAMVEAEIEARVAEVREEIEDDATREYDRGYDAGYEAARDDTDAED